MLVSIQNKLKIYYSLTGATLLTANQAEASEFQDKVGKFIAEAIREKIEKNKQNT
jgi:hypothetical protein